MQQTIPVKKQKFLCIAVLAIYWICAGSIVEMESGRIQELLIGVVLVAYSQHFIYSAIFDTTMFVGPGFGRINKINDSSRPFRYFLGVLGAIASIVLLSKLANF